MAERATNGARGAGSRRGTRALVETADRGGVELASGRRRDESLATLWDPALAFVTPAALP